MTIKKLTQAKVAQQSAGVGFGAALAVILAWALGEVGIEMPQNVAAAVGSILGAIVQEVSALFAAWEDES